MKALKIDPSQVFKLKHKTHLSRFWEHYFQNLSVDFTKSLFQIIKKPINVKLISCETTDFDSYNENLNEKSLVQFFKIYPHSQFGFYSIPYKTFELLLTSLIGGNFSYSEDYLHEHDLTTIDQNLIGILIQKLIVILERPLKEGLRNIDIELMDINNAEILKNSSINNQNICVQEYIIQVEEDIFHFDLVFTSQFLEQFTIV